jgi:hypothetical protein
MGDSITVRSFVTFRSELERVDNPSGKPLPALPDPPGARIAERLVVGLRSRGRVAADERSFEDYCRMIDCTVGQTGFEIRVGYIGDDPQQWLVMIDSTLSFFGRLLGRKDFEDQRSIVQEVDQILREESALCSLFRWYTPKEWDAGGVRWAEHPLDAVSAR